MKGVKVNMQNKVGGLGFLKKKRRQFQAQNGLPHFLYLPASNLPFIE
jgi:uncharacterized protein YwqG